MNAPARFDGDRHAAFADADAIDCDAPPDRSRAGRSDGWTPARQHAFLAAVAEGHSV